MVLHDDHLLSSFFALPSLFGAHDTAAAAAHDSAATGAAAHDDIAAATAGGHDAHGARLEFRDYYAAACPHCQDLDPAWKEAAKQYGSGPVTFRQIECQDKSWHPVAENAQLCGNIHAYPTLKLYAGDHEVATFDDDRTPDKLLSFAKEHETITASAGAPVAAALLGPPPVVAAAAARAGRLARGRCRASWGRRSAGSLFL